MFSNIRFGKRSDCKYNNCNNRHNDKPVIDYAMTQIHIELCNPGKFSAYLAEHILIGRNNFYQHYNRNNNCNDTHRNRVNHCFFNHRLCLMWLFQLCSHTIHSRFQTTGRFTRSHHVHHNPREYLRMLFQGIRQGLTLFHADADFLQCIL